MLFVLLGVVTLLPAALAKDFTKWYPIFDHWEEKTWTNCVNNATNLSSESSCGLITNCILDSLPEDFKAMLGSIGVFLGFTPTLISLMGPSVMDIALLSIKRPLLSTFCACGTAGFFFERPFKLVNTETIFYDTLNSGDNIKHEPGFFSWILSSPLKCRIISITQYILAAAAAANVIHNSYQVGLQAVITFSCHTSGRLPLEWYSFSIATHVLGMLFMHSSFKITPQSQLENDRGLTSLAATSAQVPKTTKRLIRWLSKEPLLGCQREIQRYCARNGPWATWSVLLRWSMDILVMAQFAMGTLVMSSVIFVRIEDAAGIVCRYLISALVVRCIVAIEINGLKYANARNGWDELILRDSVKGQERSETELLQR
ncbi:hypothetical protein V500_04953 [Pseudogymnoascus sp. VKM F-4518 (FW-2643)]|nr:hypothetical protein V500_04953 [Pseudogymnoascus sp. VKM F-4518 (FW-2643)]